MRLAFAILIIVCISSELSLGQDADSSFYHLTIEDLISSEISIASKKQQSLIEAPAIVTVLSSDQMKFKGANTLFEGLDLVPGFTAFRSTNADRTIVVRGVLSLDGILVMMDGVPMNDPIDGSFSFYDIPLNSIEKVEIIRGPGSALYGGYALVAVINIIMRSDDNLAKKNMLNIISGQNRGFDGGNINTNIYVTKNTSKTNFSASLGFLSNGSQNYTITSDKNNVDNKTVGLERSLIYYFDPQIGENMEHSDQSLATREDFNVLNGHFIFKKKALKISAFTAYRNINPLFSYRNATWWDDRYNRKDVINSWLAEYTLKKGSNLTITPKLYGSYIQRNTSGDITGRFAGNSDLVSINQIKYGLGEIWGDGRYEERKHHTLTTTAEVEFNFNISVNNQFKAGIVYENTHIGGIMNKANFRSAGKHDAWKTERSFLDENADDFPESTEIKDFTDNFPWISNRTSIEQDIINSGLERQVYAIFLQDFWNISKNISVILGTRLSSYNDFGFAVNPRFGIVINKGPMYFKLLYGSAFKPPAFSQLFDQSVVESQGKIQLQGNSDLKASEIDSFEFSSGYNSRKFQFNFSGYYFKTKNEILFDQTFSKWGNVAQRTGLGGEFEFNLIFSNLIIENSLSFYHTSGIEEGLGAAIYPKLKYVLGFSYLYQKWSFFAGSSMRFNNNRENSDNRENINNTIDVYTTINYKLNENFLLKIIGRNILNQNIIDMTPEAFNILNDIPRDGRSIWIGVSFNF